MINSPHTVVATAIEVLDNAPTGGTRRERQAYRNGAIELVDTLLSMFWSGQADSIMTKLEEFRTAI